jgi:hypothetical protein
MPPAEMRSQFVPADSPLNQDQIGLYANKTIEAVGRFLRMLNDETLNRRLVDSNVSGVVC